MASIRSEAPAISSAEWQVRVDLAAFYRLAATHGWDDLIYTHISARVPGEAGHFLINPFGLMFEEITASSLVKVDLDGNIVGQSTYGINRAGYVIHSAIHAARPDAHYIAHFHSADGMAVSAQKEGMLPLNQRALVVIPHLAYHDYEGIALNLDEQARLIADLGDKRMLLLRNHGTLALGTTPGEAWRAIYDLERACTTQVRTLSAGREGALLAPEVARSAVARQIESESLSPDNDVPESVLIWEAALRKAMRKSPGFDK